MEFDQRAGGEPDEVHTARLQRDQALACAFLSLLIALVVVLLNLGSEPAQIQQARAAVQQHKSLLAQHEEILRVNQAVLAQNRAELEKLRHAAHPQIP